MLRKVFLRVEEGLYFDNFGLKAVLEQVELIDDGIGTGVM